MFAQYRLLSRDSAFKISQSLCFYSFLSRSNSTQWVLVANQQHPMNVCLAPSARYERLPRTNSTLPRTTTSTHHQYPMNACVEPIYPHEPLPRTTSTPWTPVSNQYILMNPCLAPPVPHERLFNTRMLHQGRGSHIWMVEKYFVGDFNKWFYCLIEYLNNVIIWLDMSITALSDWILK